MTATLAAATTGGGCALGDIVCGTGQVVGGLVSSAAQDSLQQFVDDILDALGKSFAALGSAWIAVPSAVVAGSGPGAAATGVPPESGAFTTLLSWTTWTATGITVLSLIVTGVLMAARRRFGDGEAHLGRIGVILLGVMLVSAASALVAGFLPGVLAGNGAGGTAAWIQGSLSWYTAGLAVLSVIVAGARMAWLQRALPLRDLAASVLTLIAVAGAGLGGIVLATRAADAFSVWVLNGSTTCSVTGDQACFGRTVAGMLALSAASPVGVLGLFVLGLLAVLMTYAQLLLMVLRSAMLVLLAGVLPVAASFTNLEVGRSWFRKALGWTVAFVLYKPAAAIVYATAFRLTGANAFEADGSGLFQILTGLTLMLVALIALPALMRFLVPAIAAIGSGPGAGGLIALGAGAAGGAEIATGAIRASHAGGAGGSPGSGGPPAGPSGANPTAAGRAAGTAAGASAGAAGGAAAAAGPAGVGVAAAGAAVQGGQAAARTARGLAQSQTGDGAAA